MKLSALVPIVLTHCPLYNRHVYYAVVQANASRASQNQCTTHGVGCRWPQKFELQMRAFRNSDRKSKTAVRSCSFPSPALLTAADGSAAFSAETGSGEVGAAL